MIAVKAWDRTRGMIGRQFSPVMDCMVFPYCRAIHTFFMSRRIDVVFLNGESEIVGLYRGVRPWRPILFCWQAQITLEFPEGIIDASCSKIGHKVNWNSDLCPETIKKIKYEEIIT